MVHQALYCTTLRFLFSVNKLMIWKLLHHVAFQRFSSRDSLIFPSKATPTAPPIQPTRDATPRHATPSSAASLTDATRHTSTDSHCTATPSLHSFQFDCKLVQISDMNTHVGDRTSSVIEKIRYRGRKI